MILENKSDTLVLQEGEVQGSVKMEIDKESHIFLMRMLSKFYSDSTGSLIREICSNALDSHRASGVKEPIIVSLKADNTGNYEFTVEDFGLGIDDQDVENIISKYGKSTKRLSVNELGMFGLGFKSPLAYTNSFYFIGRKNGIERKWMMYESDEEINKIDLLFEKETSERNGVKVIVPIKYEDTYRFVNKIKEQLAYFEDVYFDVGGIRNENIKIVRHEHFQWSSLSSDNLLHICLDNVYYPIDFNKLGIPPLYFPIALRFSLTDGIFPIPNREQLKYTESAKKIILDRLSLVADYFVDKYNESVKDTDDLYAIVKHYSNNTVYIPHFDGISTLNITVLSKYSSKNFINPKLSSIKYLTKDELLAIVNELTLPYSVKYIYNNGRFSSVKNNWQKKISFDDTNEHPIYLFTELSYNKKLYLKEIIKYNYVKFVKKGPDLSLGYSNTINPYSTYCTILELWKCPKSEWRDRIKEFQLLQKKVVSKFIDVDKIQIPKSWFEERKKRRVILKSTVKKKLILSGQIVAKQAERLRIYRSGQNCKFISTTIDMKSASKSNIFTIYGRESDNKVFQDLFEAINRKEVRLLILSDRNIKAVDKLRLHNWIKVDKFMEGNSRIFKRIVTAHLINKLYKEYCYTLNHSEYIRDLSEPLYHKIESLYNYRRMYFVNELRNDFSDKLISIAKEHNMFDLSIYDVYKDVKSILERFPFLETMIKITNRENNNVIRNAIKDLFKYHKYRMNYQNYKLPN